MGGRSAKIVEERRVGLVQYFEQLLAHFPSLLEDASLDNFFQLTTRLASEAAIDVRVLCVAFSYAVDAGVIILPVWLLWQPHA